MHDARSISAPAAGTGAVAPRRLGVAFALGLAMPGLGHIYCGQVRRGLSIWAAAGGLLALALAVFAELLFVPWLPALVVLAGWAILQTALLAERGRYVREHGARYRLSPINHWLCYLAVFLGLWVLPAVVGVGLLRARVGSVAVASDAMFPWLLPGDHLLVDRDAFAARAPEVGELVVLSGPAGPRVARVVAIAGQTVHLRDGRPVIDGAPAPLTPVGALSVARFQGALAARLDALAGFIEHNGERPYLVTYDAAGAARSEPPPVRVGAEQLYVLGDNRDAALRDRDFGRVELAAVSGRPTAVWLSVDDDGAPRAGRVGVRVE